MANRLIRKNMHAYAHAHAQAHAPCLQMYILQYAYAFLFIYISEIPLPSSPSKQITHVISEPKETSKSFIHAIQL